MDLSEGLCLGTASLKRDTAFVRLRKPYSDSAELVEALVHAGVVSRIGPSTLRVPAVVLVLVLGGPGGCRLCRTGLSLSSAGQGQRCPRPTRGTAPRVSGSRQSALVCAVDAGAASASLRRVCWALDLLPLMSLSHAANTAAATNAAVTAPLWPPPPRALVPLSARLEFAAQGFTAGQGASPNDLESAGTRRNGRFSRWGLFCHDSLMRCRLMGH